MAEQLIDRDAVLERIREAVHALGSISAAARAWGVSQGYLSRVLSGERPPGRQILKQFGFRKHEAYSKG